MARWTPEKKDVLSALAAEILHNYRRGRAIVAVDGAGGTGTHAFADDLAGAVREAGHHAVRGSIDAFQRPRAERQARGADSAEARYEDSYDYSTFRRVLIEPFRTRNGASFVTSAFDADRDEAVQTKWITAPVDALLIVDGLYLNRPELAGVWNYSIWLQAAADATGAGSDAASAPNARDAAADRLYRAEASPRTTATAIMDNADPEHPRRVFADSC